MKIKVTEDSYLLEYLINKVNKSRKLLKSYLKYESIKVNNKAITQCDKIIIKNHVY